MRLESSAQQAKLPEHLYLHFSLTNPAFSNPAGPIATYAFASPAYTA